MPNKPKIGIALSGGAGRAVGHFAVLDTLKENGIEPEIVVGCSSGALVAVAYAAGTMDFMRNQFMTMTNKKLWSKFGFWHSRGGLFHLHKVNPEFEQLTKNLNFEQLPIKVGVTAADIESGELVTIDHGNITNGLKATVAIPGLFEPVIINGRILLEGGLVNIVPTIPVKQLGADIVIGVDVARNKFFFQQKMPLFRAIRRVRRFFGIEFLSQEIIKPIRSIIMSSIKNGKEGKRRMPNAFRIFFWAIDHSYNIEEEWDEEKRSCDILIEPPVKNTGRVGIEDNDFVYNECRKATLEAIPKIKELIRQFEQQKEKVNA